jgi:glycosyltransferase involved in cell wall biosynthesis
MKIVYLTAGAAGMICGSCLHDNTLARALGGLGHDVQLIPLYTPIRTDEEDVSSSRIFYGGINMYLQQKVPLFRWLPKWLDRWLDQPWLINWAAGRGVKIDPPQVADLTLSILRGTDGFQKKEIERLVEWLADLKPDVIVFSNILTAGCVPEIKRRMDAPVVVTLQGDDIFLRGLPTSHQQAALAEIRRLSQQTDAYIVHSRYYADAMADYLSLDREKIHIVPLGIDTRDFDEQRRKRQGDEETRRGAAETSIALPSPPLPLFPSPPLVSRPPTIGYLARLAPEKGLHILADAFILLKRMPGTEAAKLRIAGWLGDQHRPYADQVFQQLRAAGVGEAFDFVGEVDRRAKLAFLSSLDVLSVPTTYREPKGLFVLEALAAGAPVVVPAHGAFPEVMEDTQGGLLHRPEDPFDLAQRLHELLTDHQRRSQLANAGRHSVLSRRNAQHMASQTARVLAEITAGQGGGGHSKDRRHRSEAVTDS